jgi:hypothetical protein
MNRRLASVLASAAFLTFVSVPAALSGAQQQPEQDDKPVERTGEIVAKAVQASCPVHPEIKARTAGKCPKCRIQERGEKSTREKGKGRVRQQQQQETGGNE